MGTAKDLPYVSVAYHGRSSQFLDLLGSKKSNTAAPANSISDNTADGTVSLSDAAQTLAKLQTLSQTDPAKFKRLTAQISSQLQTAAQNTTGSPATFLTKLSNDFKTASQTGRASSLEPSQQSTQSGCGTHHGHHHGGHASSYSADTATTSFDAGGSSSVLQSIFQEVSSA